MASILKVDQLLKTDGSIFNLSDAGVAVNVGVIQMVYATEYRSGSETHVANGSTYSSPWVTITPKSTNSAILIEYNATTLVRSAQGTMTGGHSKWYCEENGGSNVEVKRWSNYGDVNNMYGYRQDRTLRYIFTNNTTATRQFRWNMVQVAGTGTVTSDAQTFIITAMEFEV